jgi:hypothetical protein
MSSQIDPDPASKAAKPAAKPAAPPAGAKPASAPPAAAKPAQPAAAQPKPAAAKPAAAAVVEQADEATNEVRAGGSLAGALLKSTPAWAISMLVHIVALLGMALIVNPPPEKEKPRLITSTAPEVEENFEEFNDDLPENDVQANADPVADVAVVPDVAVVADVQVVSTAADIEAAPLAVELTDFGAETAPAADMLSSIGAAGGTAGGLGGRKNAAQLAATSGGGKDTEEAVDRALKWFIAHQCPDGGWDFDLKACPSCQGQCSHPGKYPDRSGATAMALLPFLGRGFTHRDGPYKKQLEAGIGYLANLAASRRGIVYQKGSHSLYVQGLAGIALSECYAMTQDNRLLAPAQLALNHIMEAQDPVGGGWRYTPKQAGDTSAVGWQLMALKSGNMAYLQVNPLTIKKAVAFLDAVQEDDGASYGYTGPGRGAATTAVGLLCRMYLGWKKDHPALQRGCERMAKSGPTKDLYYSYYGTQIMHHMEGDMWRSWNARMKEMLLKTQSTKGHEAGSWYEGVEGGHADYGGRIYCTSLATMMLEVYYRHLPIYKNQSVEEEFKE